MTYDCSLVKGNQRFRYRAAAIIIEDQCILFAGNAKSDYYYSIGGAVHLGETAEQAVVREVMEETGIRYEVERLVFIHENFFEEDGIQWHEVSFYFLMKPRGTQQLNSHSFTQGVKEEMCWLKCEQLASFHAYPTFLKDYISNMPKQMVHIVTHE